MTVEDFKTEQNYHNQKRKLWNRKLHGSGVVYGLNVTAAKPESSKIIITPGMALDGQGNEIWVRENYEVDLAKVDLAEVPVLCSDTSDAEQKSSPGSAEETAKYYITLKYNETPADPKQGYAPADEGNGCSYSRMNEGCCVELFKIPSSGTPEEMLLQQITDCLQRETPFECLINNTLATFQAPFHERPYPCPTCRCEGKPYVVLGTLDLQETNGKITTISQEMIAIHEGRAYIATSPFWQRYLGSFLGPLAAFKKKAEEQIITLETSAEELKSNLGKALERIEALEKKHANYGRVLFLSIMALIFSVIAIIWLITKQGTPS